LVFDDQDVPMGTIGSRWALGVLHGAAKITRTVVAAKRFGMTNIFQASLKNLKGARAITPRHLPIRQPLDRHKLAGDLFSILLLEPPRGQLTTN
jgi:hypothetical protein